MMKYMCIIFSIIYFVFMLTDLEMALKKPGLDQIFYKIEIRIETFDISVKLSLCVMYFCIRT